MEGYIYVLSNRSMPGIYKIGCTSRSVEERIVELSISTGVPTTFEKEYSFYVQDIAKAEALLLNKLQPYRISKEKEFFKVNLDIIKKACGCLFWDFQNRISKISKDVELTGSSYYEDNYMDLLESNYETLKKEDYNFEYFSNIYRKGNIYYEALCFCKICSVDAYMKWVNQKRKPFRGIKYKVKNQKVLIRRASG